MMIKRAGRQPFIIALLFALQVTDGIDQAALAFTAPFLRSALNIETVPLGIAFSAGYIGTALGAVLFGTVADYTGRKLALCVASMSFAVGAFCTIFVRNGPELIAVRLLTGLALGGLLPVVASLVFETSPAHYRATAMTLVSVGTAAGVALCGPLVAVIEPHFGWRAVFIIGGAIPAFLSILAMLFIPNRSTLNPQSATASITQDAAGRRPLDSIGSLFRLGRWRITILLWLAFVASGVPMFFSLSWLPTLAHAAHIDSSSAAIGPSLFSVCGLFAAMLIARVIDKKGFAVVVLTTALAAPAFIVLGQSFGSTSGFLLACGVAGAFSVSSVNLMAVVAGILYPDVLRARGVGWAVAVMRLGAALAPGLGGLLVAHAIPVGWIFTGIALSPLISAFAVWWLWSFERWRSRGSPPGETVELDVSHRSASETGR